MLAAFCKAMAYLFGSSAYPCAYIVASDSLHVQTGEHLTTMVRNMWAQDYFVARLVSIEDETTDSALVKANKVVEMAQFMANILSYSVVKTSRESMPIVFGVEVGKLLASTWTDPRPLGPSKTIPLVVIPIFVVAFFIWVRLSGYHKSFPDWITARFKPKKVRTKGACDAGRVETKLTQRRRIFPAYTPSRWQQIKSATSRGVCSLKATNAPTGRERRQKRARVTRNLFLNTIQNTTDSCSSYPPALGRVSP